MQNKSKDSEIREQLDTMGRPTLETLEREIARLERLERYRKWVKRILSALIIAAAVIVLIINLFITVLKIEGTSMTPVLEENDIVISVPVKNPEQEDIIAFYLNNKLLVKRVIAGPGDMVSINERGVVSVNGSVLNESYITQESLGSCDISFPYQVPAETVFVLGDNRPISQDSRLSQFGTVDIERIEGKVILRIWPLSRLNSI